MILYAATIFSGAFLLFLVQPVIAKQILPWFGGSAAVWTTCMVFFQFVLLFGYAYADWTTRRLAPRTQVIVHAVLLAASLFTLPIVAAAGWKPIGDEEPVLLILGLLAVTIGLPYFLLSTTGPLVQAWFARSFPTGTVYRLFALSNLGSLLALLSYPVLLEPLVATVTQSYGWSLAYAVFVALCAGSAVFSLRRGAAAAPTSAPAAGGDSAPAPRAPDYAMWLVLAALGSYMLLAVTNHITQNIASIPFLWLLPLTLYLLTFILCFEGRGWYQRKLFLVPVALALGAMAWGLQTDRGIMDVKEAVPLYAAGLFVVCMFFHGELADMKPPPRYLTSFYLMVSLGGALGGLFVGVLAPKIFPTYYEFGIGLVVSGLLALWLLRAQAKWMPAAALAVTVATGYYFYQYVVLLGADVHVMQRNFYGTLRVRDTGPQTSEDATRRMLHGVIMHGEQYIAPHKLDLVTSYFGPTSGIGIAMRVLDKPGKRIGVIGLGVGTLAVYGRAGDTFRFYEINPQVIESAYRDFSYLGRSKATIEMVLGDARLSLEREPPQRFDLLAVDAFSSASVPVHLLTKEALAVYARHMKPDGVVVFQVTNRFLHLAPVVKRIADEYGMHAVLISDEPSEKGLPEFSSSEYVLVTRDAKFTEHPDIRAAATPIEQKPGMRTWTDDFNNLFQVLK